MKMLMNIVLAAAMVFQLALATDYTVGSPKGSWDQLTDLPSWVTSHNFMVGDTLIFDYSTMHDVVEVSKSDYDSCATSSPLMTDASGKTVIPLKAQGKRYFICGIPGHCDMGMKIQVNVLAKTTLPSPKAISPKANPPSISSTANYTVGSPSKAPSGSLSSAPSPSSASPTVAALSPSPSSARKVSYEKQPVVVMALAMASLLIVFN